MLLNVLWKKYRSTSVFITSKDFKYRKKKSNAWNAVVSQFHDLSQSKAIRVKKLKISYQPTLFPDKKKSTPSSSGRDAKKQILFSDSSDQVEITWSFGYFGSLEYFTQILQRPQQLIGNQAVGQGLILSKICCFLLPYPFG